MDSTDRPSPYDEFTYLEEMAATPGPALIKEIFVAKNVKAFARLLLKDEPRFMAIFQRLHYLGSTRTRWRKAVGDLATKSVNDRAKQMADEKLETVLEAARGAGKAVLDKGRPVDIAKVFLAAKRPHLAYVGGQWLDYSGTCYSEVAEGGIGAEVQAFMDGAVDADTGERFIIGPREVDHVVDALKKSCFGAEGS